MMDGKCSHSCYLVHTYVIPEFQVGLGSHPFTYVLQAGTACEHDLQRSRWDNGEQFQLLVPR